MNSPVPLDIPGHPYNSATQLVDRVQVEKRHGVVSPVGSGIIISRCATERARYIGTYAFIIFSAPVVMTARVRLEYMSF